VVYSWGRFSLLEKLALLPVRWVRKLVRVLRRTAQSSPAATQGLYFHAFPYTWFMQTDWPFELEIRTWRSVSVDFLRAYVHPWLLGRLWLRFVYWLEERLPHLAGRIGQYPLFVLRK
jgi:hypothetical protein